MVDFIYNNLHDMTNSVTELFFNLQSLCAAAEEAGNVVDVCVMVCTCLEKRLRTKMFHPTFRENLMVLAEDC